MHIDLHSLREQMPSLSVAEVWRNWKEQPRASPQTRSPPLTASHQYQWLFLEEQMTSTTPPMQHPSTHIWMLASRPLAVLPPPLESLIPTPVCHHGNSTHREACHRFRDTRAIGKRTHTRSHSLTLMLSCRTGGWNFFENGTVAAQKPPAHFPRIHYSDSVSIFNPENHFVFNFN